MCLGEQCSNVSRREVLGLGLALPWAARVWAAERDASGLSTHSYEFERGGDRLDGFVAYAESASRRPAVVVLHGNAGLPGDVKATATWIARLGFVGFAVNPTSREPDPSTIPRAFLAGREFGDRYIADARAGLASLRNNGIGAARIGIVGYCGGGYTALLWGDAEFGDEIAAFIGIHTPFHNRNPDGSILKSRPQGIDLFRSMRAPTQLHFGGADGYTPTQDVEEVRELGERENKRVEIYTYDGAGHGFALFTDRAYRAEAARGVEERAGRALKEWLGDPAVR